VVVGHITPKFKLPNDWIFVSPSSKDKSAFSQYFDTSTPFLDNNLLGEYYYLFAVRKFLANHANYELVRISHYRRLASNIQIGLQSTNQPYSNFLSEDEISKFDIDEITTPKPHGWLIPSVFNMTVSAIHQYSMFHHIRDVFRFYADIVDDGVMEETSIYNCCFSNSIIPAPSISTIPAKEFIYIYEKLENSMLSFLKSGYCARDGYQTRV
ncbi:hypothetical protein, partial [Limnohabitans sp.]|uniref:hypothetical protein n=1 Tax=Limnohabitans sp. TaxID=1907725 RepID=UPI002FDD424E